MKRRLKYAEPLYEAVYQDSRDDNESAVAECSTVDDCSDALALYFKRSPESLAHLTYWRIIRRSDGLEMAYGTTMEV